MVTAGTVQTLRVTGVPAGYPAEQESNVKVRYIDNVLEVMSDYDVPLLKAVGGIDQFTANNTKFEWVLGDTWSDRGTASGSHTSGVTTLTLDGAYAHRFPRGTVLKWEDEQVWVVAQASPTTLTIARGYAGTTAAAHGSGTEFRLAGLAEVEGTTITFRGSALREVPYNFFSIYKTGLSESWAQSESNIYTRTGATIPEMKADAVNQIMVGMEAQIIEGRRYAGTGPSDPPASGGLRYFGTSANGATVIDAGGAKLSRDILNIGFDASFRAVGAGNMGRTVLGGVGVGRTLWKEFKEPQVRTTPGDGTHIERFDALMNEYGRFEFLGPYKRIENNELWIVNLAGIEVGRYGTIGRLHEFGLPTNGDFNAMGIYGMYGNKIKKIPGIIRIYNFTTD